MPWITLQIASLLLNSVNSVLDRKLVRDHESHPIVYLLSFSAVGFPVAIAGLFLLPWPGVTAAGMGLLAGSVFAAMVLLYYKALSLDEVSRLAPVLRLSSVLSLTLLAIFLNDRLSAIQYIASGLMMLGAVALSQTTTQENDEKGFRFSRGVLLMGIVAVLSAIHSVLSAQVSLTYSPWVLLTWSNAGMLLSTGIVFVSPKARVGLRLGLAETTGRFRVVVLGEQTGRLATGLLSDFAVQHAGSAAIVSVIGGLRPFIVLVLAVIFLGERFGYQEWRSKMGGVGLMGLGTVLLFLG
jgi:transporter family protein